MVLDREVLGERQRFGGGAKVGIGVEGWGWAFAGEGWEWDGGVADGVGWGTDEAGYKPGYSPCKIGPWAVSLPPIRPSLFTKNRIQLSCKPKPNGSNRWKHQPPWAKPEAARRTHALHYTTASNVSRCFISE